MVDLFPGEQAGRHIDGDVAHAAALSHRVELTKMRIALRASPRILISGMVGVLVVLLSVSWRPGTPSFDVDPWHLAWAVATLLSLANGVFLRARFASAPDPSDALAQRTVRWVTWNAMLIGCMWGATGWLMIPSPSFQQDAVVLVAICMVLTGGAGSQAVYGPLVRRFAITFTSVFALGLFSHGDLLYSMLGLCYLAYCVATLHYSSNQERAIAKAVELSLRNEQLVDQKTQQRHEAEEAKLAAEQARADAEAALALAERADRAKSSFIAAVSHDLRQPMHALVQYVEHLKHLSDEPALMNTVEKIDQSIGAMEDLMNAVLDFSKISMGSIKPRQESFDIALLMRDVDTQMRPLAQSKGLRLQMQVATGYVYSDRVLLERIVRNITQNAIRYTASGTVQLRVSRQGDRTRILVSDSGIGIRAEDKVRIFEEYFQVNNAARDRSKGLGLGLAIVRDLSTLLEHRVRIKSLPGKGSTFAVELPSSVPPVDISSVHAPRSWRRQGEDYVRGAAVLVVDDDALARDGLDITLQDFGCRVITAASGPEALALLRKADFLPQFLVSDYRLADGENGVDVIRRLRTLNDELCGERVDLPAIVISGDTSPVEMEHVLAAELEMLHKPVSIDRLYEAMNAGLRKRMHLPA